MALRRKGPEAASRAEHVGHLATRCLSADTRVRIRWRSKMIKNNKDLFDSLYDPPAGLPRQAAPWAAFMQENWLDLLSDRVASQTYQPVHGMDLGALCVRPNAHEP
jgi:hypothetical protein